MRSPRLLLVACCLLFQFHSKASDQETHQSFYDLFEMASSQNYNLQAAEYNTLASLAGLNGARANFLPKVSMTSSLTYSEKTDEVLGTKTEDQIWNRNFAQLSISLPIFSKALKQLHLLKKFQHKMSVISEDLQRKSFYQSYVELYGSLVLLETNRGIQMANVKFYSDLLDGEVGKLDANDPIRIQIELTYHQTNLGFNSFMAQYNQLRAQFLAITGIDELRGIYGLGEDFDIKAAYPPPPKGKEERKQYLDELCEKATSSPLSQGNLQYKLAALQLEQAEALEKNARLWDVNVFAQAGYGISQIEMDSLGATIESSSWNATLGVTIPLVDFTYRHQRRESFYQMLSAQSNLREAKRQLLIQGQSILYQLDSAYASYDAFFKKVAGRTLEELIKTQQKRFKDVLSADEPNLAAILAEAGSTQLSFQASLQASNAVKDIIVNNLKLRLFTGEISEQDIQELSGFLTEYTLLPEYREESEETPAELD